MNRERAYAWEDPIALAAAARVSTGLDFLTRIGNGELPIPPVSATTGIMPIEVGDGWAIFQLEPGEWHYNPIGSVHGGILSTLADSALGCAVHTKLPAGTGYTSLDLTIKFTRAATTDSGLLTCEGRVVTIGRRTATAEATITDSNDKLIAHAVATCMLLPMAPSPPA
ncbi:PaaI family thioesterase [Antrihabitans stalactiti]|uniref:PaaI family thioesterase n=1 Tax=Antrihabitans stalactiti TaxID=2584121 RepID=A0A848KHX3_9NOCA|nr:PaaI family thioesterase [Antrihabitans stalactiti]NMN98335.1 PaaI family thioesterase [Antrihabitans stalactiti]